MPDNRRGNGVARGLAGSAAIERTRIAGLTVIRASPHAATRPPMLFIHGFLVGADVFERMMARFAESGHPCYAVNLRGRAGSRPEVDLGRASMRDFADDASAVAEQIGAPIIVGHSMGGLVAQLVAERGLGSAVVLFAPAPPRGIPLMSPRLAIAQLPYLPATLLSRRIVPNLRALRRIAFNRVPADQIAELESRVVPDSGRAGREMSLTGVPVDRAQVAAPMLVIGGDHDRFVPLDRVRKVARYYGATFRVAAGRGHMLIIEPAWEELVGWVEEWVDDRLQTSNHGER